MANVSFTMGTDKKVNQVSTKQGQILVSTDTQKMYVDTSDTERINISGVGKTTKDKGEIFNLYETTTESLGIFGSQQLPANKAGQYAHAEGVSTEANGRGSHAEGAGVVVNGEGSHGEGAGVLVTGAGSHAEGRGVRFQVLYSYDDTENKSNIMKLTPNTGNGIDNAQYLNAIDKNSVLWMGQLDSTNGTLCYITEVLSKSTFQNYIRVKLDKEFAPRSGNGWIITGAALSPISHVEGNFCVAADIDTTSLSSNEESSHQRQHAEGSRTLSLGYAAHSEGELTVAEGNMSHAQGKNTIAKGGSSFAGGDSTLASGYSSTALGYDTTASNDNSMALGYDTEASGKQSVAMGHGSKATNANAQAGGYLTMATGEASHAEGVQSVSSGYGSHAEGCHTKAQGEYSHAEGHYTTAKNDKQTVIGTYNFDNNKTQKIIFEIEEEKTGGQLQIFIGAYTDDKTLITKELSFYNPKLIYKGKNIITIPLDASNYYDDSNGSVTGFQLNKWNLFGAKHIASDRTDNMKLITLKPGNTWSYIALLQERTTLKPGTYELIVEGYGALDQLPAIRVKYEKEIITEGTNDQQIPGIPLFTVGNGSDENNKTNALDVYSDGHAEVQVQGYTDNSVVLIKTLNEKITKLEAAIKALGGTIE